MHKKYWRFSESGSSVEQEEGREEKDEPEDTIGTKDEEPFLEEETSAEPQAK